MSKYTRGPEQALPVRTLYRPSPNDWAEKRGEFTRLYVNEGKTLKQIAEIFQRRYGFDATERMFKMRVKQWQLDKKAKDPEMRAMYFEAKKREEAGKRTSFMVRGRRKELIAVKTYFVRKGVDLAKLESEMPSVVELPRDIRAITPLPEESQFPHQFPHPGSYTPTVASATPKPPKQATSQASSSSNADSPEHKDVYQTALVLPARRSPPVNMLLNYDVIPVSPASSPDLKHISASLSSSASYFPTMFITDYWKLAFEQYPKEDQPDAQPLPWAATQVAASYAVARGDSSDVFKDLNNSSAKLHYIFKQQRPELIPCMLWLISEFEAAGQTDLSTQVLSFAAELSRIVLGDQHPITMIIWCLYASDSRLLMVEPIMREIIKLFSAAVDRHDYTLSFMLQITADLVRLQKRYGEADALWREVIRRSEESAGPNSKQTVTFLLNAVEPSVEAGSFVQAETGLRDILDRVEVFDDREYQLAMQARVHFMLCMIEQAQGNQIKADTYADEAVRLGSIVWARPEHPSLKFWKKRIGR
ncbi:MAG: hypothetical protein Q9160_006827 [Pyrenula sp. 1 TL-2023]